jgi:hypothetical protein
MDTPAMSNAIPLHGLPPFVLGMSREQALAAGGEPELREQEDTGPTGAVERWHHASGQVQLTFGAEYDWRLEAIDVDDTTTTINGVALIGCLASELPERAAQAGITDLQMSEALAPDEFGRCHESDSQGLLFWEAAGHIVSITLFPAYDASGNQPLWPQSL